jgi:tRNA dimethylallyltransferase
MQASPLRQIALIGATATGKSALALKLAQRHQGLILSLDSLALYRGIDIASAKPSPEELAAVPHYGIDLLDPDQPFDVIRFLELYREVSTLAARTERPLFIVGGSAFYLKILLEGISPLPAISPEVHQEVARLLREPERAFATLRERAPHYAAGLAAGDRYRLEKGLLILFQTGQDPREYFRLHPPRPVVREPLPLFEIHREREELRQRIRLRTRKMLEKGLVDEVAGLEARYGRGPQAMKAIGIREVLEYFDGIWDYRTMEEKIVTHTARLAKRQRTFNQSQFENVVRGDVRDVEKAIERLL